MPKDVKVEDPDTISGQADSAEDREKKIIRIGKKEVIYAFVGLTCAFVIGAVAWQFSKYWLLDRRYEKLADKAVEGIKAIGGVIEKVDESDIDKISNL